MPFSRIGSSISMMDRRRRIIVGGGNSAPVITVPGAQTTGEELEPEISGISIADSDNHDQTVTITVDQGTVTLDSTTGLSFAQGDGTNDSVMEFTGTLTDVNAALNDLTYIAPAGIPTDTITIATNDGHGGTDDAEIDITINQAPVIAAPAEATVAWDATKTFSGGDLISIADGDSASITTTVAATKGTATLSGTTGLSFSVGDGTDDATMTFSGSVANTNSALSGLIYDPTDTEAGAATLTLTANDGVNTAVQEVVGITVVPPLAFRQWLNESGYVFQDAAGTTPADVDDPTGNVGQRGIGGVDMTQSSAGNRPTRKADGWLFGGTHWLQSSDSGLPTGDADRTLTAWIKANSAPAADAIIVAYGACGVEHQACAMYIQGTTGKAAWSNWTDAGAVSSASVCDGNFHLIAARLRSSTTMEILVDGAVVGTLTQMNNTTLTGEMDIGRANNNSSYADFTIDDARVWDSALSDGFVEQLFDAGPQP